MEIACVNPVPKLKTNATRPLANVHFHEEFHPREKTRNLSHDTLSAWNSCADGKPTLRKDNQLLIKKVLENKTAPTSFHGN